MMTARIQVPPSANWYAAVDSWPMLGNDNYGDCVPCGAIHCLQSRLTYAEKPVTFGDQDALNLYGRWGNYPAKDEGCVMSEAMADWAKNGIPLPDGTTDTPTSYVTVNPKITYRIQLGISQCGSVMMGIECPEAWLDIDSGALMDIPDGVGEIAGGHCVLLVGYEPTALGLEFDAISWGARYRMTERAMLAVADEAYAILDRDWLDADGVNPAGVDWATAEAATKVIAAS
jgi:hypothetical protein